MQDTETYLNFPGKALYDQADALFSIPAFRTGASVEGERVSILTARGPLCAVLEAYCEAWGPEQESIKNVAAYMAEWRREDGRTTGFRHIPPGLEARHERTHDAWGTALGDLDDVLDRVLGAVILEALQMAAQQQESTGTPYGFTTHENAEIVRRIVIGD